MAEVEPRPWLLHRVIQMIDENKEQLRNLFRNYNVLDVQPAISVQLPDDMSALQVRELGLSPRSGLLPLEQPANGWPALSSDGHHCPGHPSVLGRHAVCPHELVLQDHVSVPTSGPSQNSRCLPDSGAPRQAGAKDQR